MTTRLMAILASEAPAFSLEEDVADMLIRETLGISEAVEKAEENREYFQALRYNLRCLPEAVFEQDPYLRQVKVNEPHEEGRFTLTTASYAPGELLAYDMPTNDGNLVVPRLGYTTKTVRFPAIYEGVTPWMSVCPSEMNTVGKDAKACAAYLKSSTQGAPREVLVLGLGLGYFPFLVQSEVSEASFTIVEESPEIRGLLILLNTVGGDVEAGLGLAELIAGMKTPTASLVLGGGHSIGVPLAVAASRSFIAPSAAMTLHPVRLTGVVIGVEQTYSYLGKVQDRIVGFITGHSRIPEETLTELMLRTGELAGDVGSVIDGAEAVRLGLIDALGSLSDALDYLHGRAGER